jgi:hypothetical protein
MTTGGSPSDHLRLLARPTVAERRAQLPGDALVSADVVMDRAFTVSGSTEQVWPWLVQLGRRRAGWYLPRTVERAVPRSRRALRHLDPALQGLAVGDVIPDWGGADATFTVVELEAAAHLLFASTRGRTNLTWCLHLQRAEGDRTRVHLRLRLGPVRHRLAARSLGGLVDLVTVAGLAVGLEERLVAGRT